MKRIAMIESGMVIAVATWDGATPWDPVAAGLCASTVDVTALPAIAAGWAYANGVFAAPAPPPPAPDPNGFGAAVFSDATIPIATRLQLVTWVPVLAQNLSQPALIAAAWGDLISALAIGSANQATIHAYAVQYGIPGI